MKRCRKCNKLKKDSAFAKSSRNKDGLQSYCKECANRIRRERFQNKKDEEYEVRKARRVHTRITVREIKEELSCEICGESHPATLDFHHKDPTEKDFSISDAVGSGYSIETVKEEISKCRILCSNCHRKLHYEEDLESI